MGELGLTGGAASPSRSVAPGFSLPRLDAGHGGARRGRHGDGRLAVGPHPVAVPGRDLGDARAAGALAAGDARRRGARGVRADRAARRLATRPRSGRAPSASGRPTRRRLPADGHEDLDLERARGRALPRLRDARSERRAPKAITAFLVEKGTPGFRLRRARAEDGDPGLPGRRARLRRRRGPGREPPRRGGRGLPDRAVGARRGPDLDRRGLRRARPGRRWRPRPRYLDGARGLRRAAGRAAGPAVHARRDGPRGGRGAGPDPRGGAAAKDRGEPIAEVVVARQVDRVGRRDAGRDRRRPALRRRAATRARPASSGCMRDAKGAQIYEGTNQIHRADRGRRVSRAAAAGPAV